jgi:hypothetical protein
MCKKKNSIGNGRRIPLISAHTLRQQTDTAACAAPEDERARRTPRGRAPAPPGWGAWHQWKAVAAGAAGRSGYARDEVGMHTPLGDGSSSLHAPVERRTLPGLFGCRDER